MKLHYLPMPDKFKYRSEQKELIDGSDIPRDLLFKNLRELDILNRTTGGHRISIDGISQLVQNHDKTYHIVDLGCGSGDAMKSIAEWARKNDFKVRLTGVDMNGIAIEYLEKHCAEYPEITGIKADYRKYLEESDHPDIVHCSLFCHHLTDGELLWLFTYLRHNLSTGFVINDLQRQPLAYYSAWLFPRVLRGTVLSRNDGPVSVLRGFKSAELVNLLLRSGIKNYKISKKRFFRFLIIGKTQDHEPND